MSYVDIVFDGPPSHKSGRFIEVENEQGESISFGEWVERPDGYWALRIHQRDRLGRKLVSSAKINADLDASLGT